MTDSAGQSRPRLDAGTECAEQAEAPSTTQAEPAACHLIDVYAQAPEGYDGTCLRPLGLCELGGACDACWYNSNREASLGQRPPK